MNASILLRSFDYLQDFKSVVSLAIWIYNQLLEAKRNIHGSKFKQSLLNEDYEISKSLALLIDNIHDYGSFTQKGIIEHPSLLKLFLRTEQNSYDISDKLSEACKYRYNYTVK